MNLQNKLNFKTELYIIIFVQISIFKIYFHYSIGQFLCNYNSNLYLF